MKLRQSSLDIYAFIEIYRDELEGSFIKKIFQVGKNEFVFQIYRSDLKRRDLFISLSRGIAFYGALRPDQASQLSIILRKNLSERKIMAVKQLNFDRIVKFELSTGQEVILEMFREGNLIITDGSSITFAMNQREWKNRKILVGETYRTPGDTDPLNLSEDEFASTVRKSRASLVQTLATRMNLGGETSEELLFRCNLDKETAASKLENAGPIVAAFRELLEESRKSRAYYYESELILSPIVLNHLGRSPDRTFEDLNDGFSFYFENYPEGEAELSPLQRRLESQRKTIEEYRKKSEEFQNLGTLVISRLKVFQKIIEEVRSKERELEKGMPLLNGNASVVSFDAGKKDVRITFQETEIPLDYSSRATENAERLFGTAKDFRSRADGAEIAVEHTIAGMQFDEEKPQRKKRNRHWFEIYHWFYSSEGFLVISGKDRKTNEKVVKKHMTDNDIYVHADLYGAPSTVIKSEGDRKPGEATLREACIFAVAHSRAWSAGILSGSAYWVFPEQVSKTPESGEYVSTGSWIVRGKRNYLFDLPMELEISMHEVSGESIPMIHPIAGNGPAGSRSVRIRPGNMKRSTAVVKIAEIMKVPTDEVDPLLPPGGSVIVD